jgi:uncharacterized protein (DUF305 family)
MMRLLFATAALVIALPAFAQQTQSGHAQHGASSMPASASSKAYQAANDKMHQDMNIRMTGDADVDFVQGMIPHHQGAVDMAKIVLQYGADPDIKKMAQDIIAAQDKEIAMFRAWLAKRQK